MKRGGESAASYTPEHLKGHEEVVERKKNV